LELVDVAGRFAMELLYCPNYKAAQWPVNAAVRKSPDIFESQ
jgi:hypothetical protein